MAMAMESTYMRWKRLVSGLAGGSSLKEQADFNPSAVTTGEQTYNERGASQRGSIYKGGDRCSGTCLLSFGKKEDASGHTELLSRPQPQDQLST